MEGAAVMVTGWPKTDVEIAGARPTMVVVLAAPTVNVSGAGESLPWKLLFPK